MILIKFTLYITPQRSAPRKTSGIAERWGVIIDNTVFFFKKNYFTIYFKVFNLKLNLPTIKLNF